MTLLANRRTNRLRAFALGFGVFAALVLGFLTFIGTFGPNIHAVIPDRVYRSAQLSGPALGRLIERDHIKTVINLRGDWPGKQEELATASIHGATPVDIPMNARRLPPPNELRKLIDTFDKSEYPVLFHCQGGSDRSGLVGTIYLAMYENIPLDEAEERQLTWRYGHFSMGETHAMNDFFDLYRRTSKGVALREWVLNEYPSLYEAQGPKAASQVAVRASAAP